MGLTERLEKAVRAHARTTGERIVRRAKDEDAVKYEPESLNIHPLISPRFGKNRDRFG